MDKIRFATMNCQNLQLPGKAMHFGAKPYTKSEYQQKTAWLAEMVRRLDADILAVQEIWTGQCLWDVFAAAGLENVYTLITYGDPKTAGSDINVGLAVRKEFVAESPVWTQEFPPEVVLKKRKSSGPDYEMLLEVPRFSRRVLSVKVQPPQSKASPVLVYVAHLKSMLPTALDAVEEGKPEIKAHSEDLGKVLSTVRRAAEAGALRVLLNQAMKGTDTPVVLMGDMNDTPDSVTLSILTGDPSYRTYACSTAGVRSDTGLYSAGWLQDLRSFRDVYYTYLHAGRYNSLDHILVSEQFYDYSKKREWSFRDLRILNDHLDEREDKELCRINSDHGGVAATFLWHPA